LGFSLQHINIGGGLGVRYQDEEPPTIQHYIKKIVDHINNSPYEIIIEPGRSIVANAGVLLTRIEYLKHTAHKNFAIVDAAMNDLIRPALYDAWQNILPVNLQHQDRSPDTYDIVGPVCESADFLGKNRLLSLEQGELLAICSAGAYGFSMSSNYNSRPRAAEVLVDQNKSHLIRQRETIQELFANEKIIL
jgi:diaminopimelate decarboxylase